MGIRGTPDRNPIEFIRGARLIVRETQAIDHTNSVCDRYVVSCHERLSD